MSKAPLPQWIYLSSLLLRNLIAVVVNWILTTFHHSAFSADLFTLGIESRQPSPNNHYVVDITRLCGTHALDILSFTNSENVNIGIVW